MRADRPGWRGAAVGLALLAGACASPVGVTPLSPVALHRTLTRSAVDTGEPSPYSTQVLQRLGLGGLQAEDPERVLAILHVGLDARGQEARLFALAELSLVWGRRSASSSHLLAAAVYAYAFLFPGPAASPPRPLDPRLRLAAEIYNVALAEALRRPGGSELLLAPGRLALPFGSLELSMAPEALDWAGHRLEGLVPAVTLDIRGLRNRYRQAGVGAAAAASLGPLLPGSTAPRHSRLPPGLKVPVTVLLRLEDVREALPTGRLRGELRVYTKDADHVATLGGRTVPLEYEPSVALALTLETTALWDTELRGFLRGDFLAGGGAILATLTPYRPGRVPVVLVHGTYSSPARWAELVNELDSDPRLASRYQFWLFTYNTGNPLLYSAMLLRETLAAAVTEFDPDGSDDALRRMVLIGHSQGGLLVRLTVLDSGWAFWDNVSRTPLADLRISAETRSLLERAMLVKALPFVRRVIFLATPHRGSELAGWLTVKLRGLLTWVLTLPANVLRTAAEIVTASEDPLLRRTLDQGMPRSVDNMSPDHPFTRTLSRLPFAPRVTVHSIIAVRGDGPAAEGDDGLVSYRSAHLDEAVSEKVVRSGHSVQGQPQAIEEVRRILLEHLDGF